MDLSDTPETKTADPTSEDDEDQEEDSKNDDTSSTDSNDDVLTTEQVEAKLIQATQHKEEGNGHFQKGQLDQAARSYRRGCTALKPVRQNSAMTDDTQVKSLLVALQNNLSMVCFKQKKYSQSIQVATQALQVDPFNVKALYRRATARRWTGDYEQARADLKEALQQDANNTACQKELATVKRLSEEYKKSQKKALAKAFSAEGKGGFSLYNDKEEEEKKRQERLKQEATEQEELLKKRKVEWEDECVKRMARNEPAISFEEWEKERKDKEEQKKKEEEKKKKKEEKKRREAQKKAARHETVVDDDDELTAEELAMMRGYKKTADGRTTSYFTRELSMEEKEKIGDIAPKRLESAPDTAPAPLATTATNTTAASGSAWNMAGTWEEKDTTAWCREQLEKRLQDTTVDVAKHSLEANIVSVSSLTGDASVAVAGGKKRYIFDFHANLKYEIKDETNDKVIAKGDVGLPDICSTSHEELEVAFNSWTTRPSSEWEAKALDSRNELASELRAAVQKWVDDFNQQY